MDKIIFKHLSLKNFATFDNQVVDFKKGFNGITGETGSGKSLILDAFQLLLGGRADKKLIRKDCDFSVVEGVFDATEQDMKSYFDNIGFPIEGEEIVIKRILYKSGKSKAFLNHMQCPLHIITSFSRRYIDLIGQFENQKLLSPEYQLKIVDIAAKNFELLNQYRNKYELYHKNKKQIEAININREEKARREDYLEFQLGELNKLSPSQKREQELVEEKNRFLQQEKNNEINEKASHLISEGQYSILSSLGNLDKMLGATNGFDDELELLSQAQNILNEISYKISSKEFSTDHQEELNQVIEELDLYQTLKRKYKTSSEGLAEIYEEFSRELNELKNIDFEVQQLKKETKELEEQMYTLSQELHENRLKTAKTLEKSISNELKQLNMKGATFRIETEAGQEFTKNGLSIITFKAETNPGEGFYNIADIASGGELSRILLTLRCLVSSSDSISIFFFDEIDTGIGGETANLIGNKLLELSVNGQVLAITHLPQIAKLTNHLIHVDKKSLTSEEGVRTISFVEIPEGNKKSAIINQLAGL